MVLVIGTNDLNMRSSFRESYYLSGFGDREESAVFSGNCEMSKSIQFLSILPSAI
jgi:hypothetical protein